MEESAFQAIYTGVYIVIFIISLTTALYLFNGISSLAELSYDYGKIVTNQSVIESPNVESLYIDANQAISYYVNYVKKDEYDEVPDGITKVSFDTADSTANQLNNDNFHIH